MSHAARIAEIERHRAESKRIVEEETARILGFDIELAYLRSGTVPSDGMSSMLRTDAILQVIRTHGPAMSPTAIRSKLHEGGRDDGLNEVNATLNYLKTEGRVVRVSRGVYQLA